MPPLPDEQLRAEVFLHVRDLSGEGWLGDVQILSRLCHVARLGNGEEVFQNANVQFHLSAISFCVFHSIA